MTDSGVLEAPINDDTMREKAVARRRRGRMWAEWILANGLPLGVLSAWWLLGDRVPEFILPSLPAVAARTGELLWGDLAIHTYTSLLRVLIAVALAALAGGALVAVGHTISVTRKLIAERILPFFNSIPALGWGHPRRRLVGRERYSRSLNTHRDPSPVLPC